jgi:hypothetical protein
MSPERVADGKHFSAQIQAARCLLRVQKLPSRPNCDFRSVSSGGHRLFGFGRFFLTETANPRPLKLQRRQRSGGCWNSSRFPRPAPLTARPLRASRHDALFLGGRCHTAARRQNRPAACCAPTHIYCALLHRRLGRAVPGFQTSEFRLCRPKLSLAVKVTASILFPSRSRTNAP